MSDIVDETSEPARQPDSQHMLRTYADIINSIANLSDQERERVLKAVKITCGDSE